MTDSKKGVWSRLKDLIRPGSKEATPKDSQSGDAGSGTPYTEEEAQKVKERLQGLGYID